MRGPISSFVLQAFQDKAHARKEDANISEPHESQLVFILEKEGTRLKKLQLVLGGSSWNQMNSAKEQFQARSAGTSYLWS